MTYTKGPWRARVSGSDGVYILPDTGEKREDRKYIAKVDGRDLMTDQANARLIAAAPELLEAATLAHRELLQSRVIDDERQELIDMLRSAIQKAGGAQ